MLWRGIQANRRPLWLMVILLLLVQVLRHLHCASSRLLPTCATPSFSGNRSRVIPRYPEWRELHSRFHGVSLGGAWQPLLCNQRHTVAVIVPYRNRENQLRAFLGYMHQFLQEQKIRYQVFIVEQTDKAPFNRGMLLNVGAVEVRRVCPHCDCLALHDVDLLPEHPDNLYRCDERPRHLAVGRDQYGYVPFYGDYLGGALAIRRSQFFSVNGFSNLFYNWGGEDDDFYNRLVMYGFGNISRYEGDIGFYTMMKHKPQERNTERHRLLHTGLSRMAGDGLNSMNHTLLYTETHQLFTRFIVHIPEDATKTEEEEVEERVAEYRHIVQQRVQRGSLASASIQRVHEYLEKMAAKQNDTKPIPAPTAST